MEPDEYESLPQYSLSTNMLAGAAAGIMEHSVMYPFDVIKTRMQSLQPLPGSNYRTVPEALYKIVRYEGFLRTLRGINAMVAGAGPAHALYFSCYEKLKRVLSGTEHGNKNPMAQAVAGVVSTLLHDGIMTPAEVVKQRLQVYKSPYKGVFDCFTTIWRTEGPRAFYRSYTTQVTMNVPFQVVHFVTYEFMQNLTNENRTFNPKAHIISGAIAGAVAAALTTPLDVCKTLLNTQDQRVLALAKQSHVSGLYSAFITVYRLRGIPGFFQGLQARVLFQMPGTAISWAVYESFKYALNKKHNTSHQRD